MNLSSSPAAWPETCTGAAGTWNTSAPVRYSPSTVRWIAVSFPGITEEDRTTASPGTRWMYLCSCAAISDSADSGSPWDPVQQTTSREGSMVSTSSMATISVSGTSR